MRNVSDNTLVKVFEVANGTFLLFTPDGKNIIYNVSEIYQDGGNLWIQPINGGLAKPYIELNDDKIFWANFSKDGKKLFYTRGRTSSNAVLLSNLRIN